MPFLVYIFSRFDVETYNVFNTLYNNGRNKLPWVVYYLMIFITFFFVCNFYRNYRPSTKGINVRKFEKIIRYGAYISLILGAFGFVMYIGALGGLSAALAKAEYARSFGTDMMAEIGAANRYMIVAKLLLLSPYCSLFVYLKDRSIKNLVMIIVSVVLFILFQLVMASRAPIIVLLIAFSFPLIAKRFKRPWLIIILASVLGSEILTFLDALFIYFDTGELEMEEASPTAILRNFFHPVHNALYAFDMVRVYGIRFGQDFFTAVLDLVPGLDFSKSYEVPGAYFRGVDWKMTGGTPCDFITFSIIEFHVVGLIFMPYVVSIILKKGDLFLRRLSEVHSNSQLVVIYKTGLMLLIYGLVSSSDFSQVVGNYSLFFYFTAILISFKKVIK